jgi:L-alanine-DL-glutamate epimerase-like enolase superfamily enzyme
MMRNMTIRIRAGDIHVLDVHTRMPFKYGIATMTRAPHAFVRLHVDVDGATSTGIAADLLPPKWFTKNPDRALEDEIAEMARVIGHAVNIATGVEADSAFAVWRQIWDGQSYWGLGEELPPLLVHFGTSLVERALIEACCRAAGMPFWRMLCDNRFGIRLGALHPALKTHEPADFLPLKPLDKVIARHTVGLADPLEKSDIAPAERLDDGLPQALASCIEAYGLRHFKIKVNGHIDRDLDRLNRVAAVIAEHAPPDFAFSLDGNEQFRSINDFMVFWNEVTHAPALRSFFRHLMFVEQPFHRDIALAATAMRRLAEWPERPSLIIDESDGDLYSLAQALRLGYAGTSHKNCKGIFKGIANACLLAQRRAEQPDMPTILSGEDLANIGPVALLQDLAVCAALGIQSIERNGHHYFAGLSMFPAEVQRATLAAHGDLYRPSRDGWPTLNIQDGMVNLASVNAAPLGVGFAVDVEQFNSLEM